MRILHTVEFYAPSVGGAQEVVRQLSERLAARGHDVTVATTRLPARRSTTIDGVRIAEFDVSGNAVRGMRGDVEGYRRFVLNGGFDVVMSYAAQQWATDALLPVVEDIPAVRILAPCGFSALQDPAYGEYFATLPERMRHFDRLVFHSAAYQDVAYARQHGLAGIEVLTNGADEREFGQDDDEIAARRTRFREAHGIDADEPLILTVGGHTGHKGHDVVIATLNALSVSRATLALVGNRPLGIGCSVSCRVRAAATNGLQRGRRVLLLDPPRDDVIDAYFASDVFVFASQFECSPLVLFEAAAAGLPFVTLPVGNAAEIAQWTGGGIVVDAPRRKGLYHGDPRAIASAVSALLTDTSQRASMSSAARAAWLERFAWGHITDRYEQLYASLVQQRPSAVR